MSREEIRPEVERLDFFILGGGGILYDGDARNYLREPMLALEKNIPVMVYAISAGPLEHVSIQREVRGFLERVSAVTVRDRKARHLLEALGVKRSIVLTADPALRLLPSSAQPLKGLLGAFPSDRRLIGMSVREPGPAAPTIDENRYQEFLANSADFMVERFDAHVVFIPMEKRVRDVQQSHAVIARMLRAEHATVLQQELEVDALLGSIGNFAFCVGMRLHFLLFASLQGVPFVGLPYSPKVHAFLEELNMDEPPLHLVNSGRLIAHIDEAWDNRAKVVEHIHASLPLLRQRAGMNIQIALDVLHSRYGTLPLL
jgi:polysaccharide pyruvyl transferase WcaK-like protein